MLRLRSAGSHRNPLRLLGRLGVTGTLPSFCVRVRGQAVRRPLADHGETPRTTFGEGWLGTLRLHLAIVLAKAYGCFRLYTPRNGKANHSPDGRLPAPDQRPNQYLNQ